MDDLEPQVPRNDDDDDLLKSDNEDAELLDQPKPEENKIEEPNPKSPKSPKSPETLEKTSNSRRTSAESDGKPPLLPDLEPEPLDITKPPKREYSDDESDSRSKSDDEKSRRKSKRARRKSRSNSRSRSRSRGRSRSRSRQRSRSRSDSESSYSSDERKSSKSETVVLKVTNLPSRPSQTSLKDGIFHEFKRHGKLESLAINEDRQTGERYALLVFNKRKQAKRAMEDTDGKRLMGSHIKVAISDIDPKEVQQQGSIVDELNPRASRTLFIGAISTHTES